MSARPAPLPDLDGCISALSVVLGKNGLYTKREDLARYETGARYGAGRAAFVMRPSSTAEVAAALKICAQHHVIVVPQGANTGLVGASTPDESGRQAVLSFERAASTLKVNHINRSIEVSAGVSLSKLNDFLESHGLWFPIDLGADPTIGGMIATNTGGTRFIRYGDVRRNVLGLEVVLYDGTILNFMNEVRKDNTGLDAKQLFIGTSGQYGIVTRAVLEVHPLPQNTATALIVPSSPAGALDILLELEEQFGPQLTSFEGISKTALAAVLDGVPQLRNPFLNEQLPPYSLLVEVSTWNKGGASLTVDEALERELERAFEAGKIENAFTQDAANLWSIRHHISDSLKLKGKVIALDVSVPRDRFVEFRDEACAEVKRLADFVLIADFGHLGDGGVHFNMIWPDGVPYDAERVESLRTAVYDLVAAHGGSFSAEHGVGPFNAHYYERYVPAAKQSIQHLIEEALASRSLGNTLS
ncbi:FAD-binding oxidoreductase [Sinorhizobium americanum]|uniref:FAD/FMN-containing dehydrogenase n=1 Tax=Sinorhizobium americanum TaxID=194963 RepID=A0A4R2BEF5_9HYPH|nr:FAD-binding oxidoreductase [Sinorhizobium americanum]TCN25338.1 FAD/FMN-containing dehydrogenase [Sinorhizobium americanum]